MNTAHRTPPPRAHVLIAVKELRRAKTRLAGRLAPDERTDLVLAMLADTLAAARAASSVGRITVITPDPRVVALGREYGADWLPDPRTPVDDPLNTVLRAAAEHPDSAVDHTALVALQGDLPCLRGDELDSALTAAASHPRSIVVDHHGTGTAALIVADLAAGLDPRFGPDSAARHLGSGATALTGHWPGLRLDVDTAEDLDAAAALGPGSATARQLRRIDWNRTSAATLKFT
ncbi:2-phospho-L-lactate guanylyltransferase [Rhodococcus kronopolitis]|uniref:Phosphoenolpyruvate guanylyltransferase n=1 Tax=Rhodococcus kronopolitis TaxID=1460226 RepID=A0ABV9FJX1_9NOCA